MLRGIVGSSVATLLTFLGSLELKKVLSLLVQVALDIAESGLNGLEGSGFFVGGSITVGTGMSWSYSSSSL